MNRAELIDAIAQRLEKGRKEASEALEAVLDEIKKAVAQGEKVSLPRFGVFEGVAGSDDSGGSRVPWFRAGTDFRAMVAGARKAVAEQASKLTSDSSEAPPPSPAAKKKAPVRREAEVTTSASRTPAKKATAKKAPAKKATAKKAPAKKAPAKKAPVAGTTTTRAKKATAAKKTTTRKATAKKAPAEPVKEAPATPES